MMIIYYLLPALPLPVRDIKRVKVLRDADIEFRARWPVHPIESRSRKGKLKP
jgi:hypothetical protein